MRNSTQRTSKPSLRWLGTVFVLGLAALSLIAVPEAQADPIQDGAMNDYKAGWFSNAGRSGPLTCTETCKLKAEGSLAEYEATFDSPAKRAFVCKVEGRPNNDVRTWLYGSQFDDRPACYTVGRDLKGSYSERYHCLCVVAARKVQLEKGMKLKKP